MLEVVKKDGASTSSARTVFCFKSSTSCSKHLDLGGGRHATDTGSDITTTDVASY